MLCLKLGVILLSDGLFLETHDFALLKLTHFLDVDDEITGTFFLLNLQRARLNLPQKLEELAVAVLHVCRVRQHGRHTVRLNLLLSRLGLLFSHRLGLFHV